MAATPARRAWAIASCLALVAAACVCALRAWIADDAFITYRVLDNWVGGFGLRWNTVDRVQVSTHPAWLLLQAPFYALTRDPATTMLASSSACLLAAAFIVRTSCAHGPMTWALVGVLPILAHRRLTEFLWSGLEPPLTLLCIAALASFGHEALRHRGDAEEGRAVAALGATTAVLFLTRPDAILIAAPLCAILLLRSRRRSTWLAFAVGLLPALAWCAFAWAYFGAPLPNTATAKLGVDWPLADRLGWGVRYLVDAIRRDPVFMVVAVVAGVCAKRALHRPEAYLVLALLAGGTLHLGWVVSIGGDFMSGRFVLPAYLACWASLWSVFRSPPSRTFALSLACGVLAAQAVGGWTAPQEPPARSDAFWAYTSRAPVDERAYYAPAFGVFSVGRQGLAPEDPDLMLGLQSARARAVAAAERRPFEQVIPAHAVGWLGYASGPRVHIVDAYGLVDPVIARQPGVAGAPVRPGHVERVLPEGYLEYLATGNASLLSDEARARIVQLRSRIERSVQTTD